MMMIKITHYSTTSNGEQMADWTAFAAPILINEDQLKHFRESLREQLGGTIYLRYEQTENDG